MNLARTPLAVAVAVVAMISVAVAGAGAKPNPHAVLDCDYCHLDTPSFGVDTLETVNFWRAEGDEPGLCERCHGPEANFHPDRLYGRWRMSVHLPRRPGKYR